MDLSGELIKWSSMLIRASLHGAFSTAGLNLVELSPVERAENINDIVNGFQPWAEIRK